MQPKTPFYLFGSVLLLGVFYFFLLSPPGNFPVGTLINIERGSSLQKVSSTLRTNKVIRSRAAFEFFVIIFGGERRVRPAYYSFERELPVFEVAWRVSGGKFRLAPVVVTIPEGFDSHQIADAFAEKLPNFNKEEFLTLVADKEGYLFPDTYFFLNTDGTQEAIVSLQENLDKKLEPLLPEIAVSGRTLAEIITMASIIEGEANGDGDRGLISGILWKRFKMGMALQADAAPITYKKKGLPEKPIGNPGLASIIAALHPEASPYLYYLHDSEGNIHYAKNFAEHTANKAKYLK